MKLGVGGKGERLVGVLEVAAGAGHVGEFHGESLGMPVTSFNGERLGEYVGESVA